MMTHLHLALLSACLALAGCSGSGDSKFECENRLSLSHLVWVNDVKKEITPDTKVTGEYRVRFGADSNWFTFVPVRIGKSGEATFIEMKGGFVFFCTPASAGIDELMPKVSDDEVELRLPPRVDSITDAFRASQVRATIEVREYLTKFEAGHEPWADGLISDLAKTYPHPLLVHYKPKTAQPGATDNLGYAQRIREGPSFRSSEARCLSFIVRQGIKP